ncbi:ATPase [Propionibacteriaceae bacterium Y1685]|uniref:ATPase n=1 Tax=Microlunatus sp. Y1700 TaxID=3418487 RepID=UPI003B7A029D
MDVPDRIERSITIKATPSAVWELVSEPGWWINEGRLTEHEIKQVDGRTVVVDPALGEFPLIVEQERAPEYVAFRWAPWDEKQAAEEGTLVEFFVTDNGDGTVGVRVVESGWSGLSLPPEQLSDNHAENEGGWELEMDLLAAAFAS